MSNIWTPSQDLYMPTDQLLEGMDPSLIPEDFHQIDVETAARLTPATLAFHITRGMWQAADHLLYLASEIAKELLEGNAHLIISMPPRHGKSELLSIWTALWWLDLFPHDHIMLATYGADLSTSFSRRVRDTLIELGGEDNKPSPEHMLDGRPRLHTTVRSDVQQVGHFLTPQGGGMSGVGLGGALTGKGANLLMIDDYVKNAKDAASPAQQKDNFDWFVSTAYTRLEPGGSVVILATRWDQGDLIGMIRADEGNFAGKWRIIELPALAFDDGTPDPLGRAPGEALWPSRYPKQRLLRIKQMLGQFYWQALYQQRPIQRSDVKFEADLLSTTDIIPHFSKLRMIRSWDLAGTKDGGDWSVGALLGQDGHPKRTDTNTFIADLKREQVGQEALEDLLLNTAQADGPEIPIIIEQEPGSSGKNYANYLANTVLRDFKVTVKPPSSNKWLKAQPFFACVARGKAKMFNAAWNSKLTAEFKAFPNGSNDDIVDAVSQGYNELMDTAPKSATWGRGGADSNTGKIISSNGNNKIVTGATFGRR